MPKETKVSCDRCARKKKPRDAHWATLHYHDTYGSNDGAGACTETTDEVLYLCVPCKRVVYNVAKGNIGKKLKV